VQGAHFSLPVSEIHLRAWKKNHDWVLRTLAGLADEFHNAFKFLSVGAQDASRADRKFLIEFALAAQDSGLSRLRIADTVGVLNPLQACDLTGAIRAAAPGLVLEFHGHNDLGMATANTVAALAAGAECASVTVNGLGERAGNAALEEVVIAAKLTLGHDCGVDPRQLTALSDLVARASGRPLAPEKAVIGAAVFRHESGIHCGGLLENPQTYEPFAPEQVSHGPSELVLGHHSGARLLRSKLARLKLSLPQEMLPILLEEVRRLATQRKAVLTDNDCRQLVANLKKTHGLSDL
jgi:homocitrate synthase NifV